MTHEFNKLLEQAQATYRENFPMETCFERAIFFSWYCAIRDCGFCFMSAQPENIGRLARRRTESLLAELILSKKLGWEIGFISGGINAFTIKDFEQLLQHLYAVHKEKFWLNIGPMGRPQLERYLPYTKGVVGSVETLNPKLHKIVCPSKPLLPIERMFEQAEALGLQKAMTLIVGLGETMEDFPLLVNFIENHSIDKIHIYGLIPQEGTMYAHAKPPTKEYQAEWIAKTRVAFPRLDIQAGLWTDRVDWVADLLHAGANSISKFPATRKFNSPQAKMIEEQARLAGRTFKGTLTKVPEVDWEREIGQLELNDMLKQQIRKKLQEYLKKLEKRAIIIT